MIRRRARALAAAALAAILAFLTAAPAASVAAEQPALVDLNGEPASLPLEDAPLLVNFWATWCPPCRHELPLLDEAVAAADGSFAVIAVAVDDLAASREYWQEGGFGFPTLVAGLTEGPRMLELYGNVRTVMPYSVLLASDGSVLASKAGVFANVEEIVDFGNSARDAA